MKKSIFSTLFALTMILGMVFCMAPQEARAEAPCPTGVSEVSHSWWGPSNDTYYTMCNCGTVSGYSSSGGCSTGEEAPISLAP